MARRLEASNPSEKSSGNNWGQRASYQKPVVGHKEVQLPPAAKQVATTVPPKTDELVAVKNDKCFRCGEKWVPGHRFHCKMNKQVRAMLTKEEEDQEYFDELNAIE
jgi:hypothetical protein